MKICYKGYGINRRLVLSYRKPSFKIKVNSRRYDNFITILKMFTNFLNKNKFFVISALWMGLIFYLSSQDANTSSLLSTRVNNSVRLVPVLGELFTIVSIRKFAHFILYFCLSIFLTFGFMDHQLDHVYIKSVLCCFLYACTDEIHQLFVVGRGAMFSDVLIDTSGAILSTFIVFLYFNWLFKFFYKNAKE